MVFTLKIPCCRSLAPLLTEGRCAQTWRCPPHHIEVRWEFNLFGFCLPLAKNNWAKLEQQTWPCPGGKAKKVRWHLTYERTHFFGVAANVLNRIANMPQAKEGRKTKTQKRRRKKGTRIKERNCLP